MALRLLAPLGAAGPPVRSMCRGCTASSPLLQGWTVHEEAARRTCRSMQAAQGSTAAKQCVGMMPVSGPGVGLTWLGTIID
mmetsp:Transcript_30144/g.66834  ORF Transcript_30144/g.66834 Transcript_30144/m.66834 type:complete len:81 (-) Transcript_30144:405-647(-)